MLPVQAEMKRPELFNFSKKKMLAVIAAIAMIQLVLLVLGFCFLKKGYSGDELYSYATADSGQSMNPLIDMDGTLHFNEWITSERIFQALTVSKDEVFAYGHINEILENDAHPPLYFYLLHFFCSFFIGRFSWIPSIIINSVSILAGQIFFYRLFLLISKDRFQSVIAMLFFGCTTSVINMMTFTRNYTLLTALTLIFTFYIFRSIWQRSVNKDNTKSVVLAAVFLYLAALTQYLSILFGFFITLAVCIYYLSKKDIRMMLKTGLSMTASIALMILSFREVIHQLSIDQTSMENASDYPFFLELRISVHILFNEIFGISTPVQPTMIWFWLFWGIGAILIIYLIMSFVFRSDGWFIRFQNRCKRIMKAVLKRMRNLQIYQYLSILVAVTASVLIISYKFKMYFYYPNSNRYLFILYPYAAILFLVPVFFILRKNIFRIIAVIGLSCLSILFGTKTNTGSSQMTMQEITETLADSDVMILVPNHYSSNDSILYMEKCDRVFYTTGDSFYENRDSFFHGLSDGRPLYLLYYWPAYANESTNSDMLKVLKDLKENGATTINDSAEYHGAQPVAGLSGHVLLRLR